MLETSGVALPGMVASALTLLQGYDLAGIAVVVDATLVRGQAADRYLADTIERQLAAADLVLLNKADLAGEMLAETAAWLRDRVPSAQVVTTSACAVPADLVLAARPRAAGNAGLRTPGAVDAAGLYEARSFASPGLLDLDTLGRTLADMPGLLRAKGFVDDPAGARRLLQVVPGQWTVSPAPDGVGTGLVVVARREALDWFVLERLLPTSCPD